VPDPPSKLRALALSVSRRGKPRSRVRGPEVLCAGCSLLAFGAGKSVGIQEHTLTGPLRNRPLRMRSRLCQPTPQAISIGKEETFVGRRTNRHRCKEGLGIRVAAPFEPLCVPTSEACRGKCVARPPLEGSKPRLEHYSPGSELVGPHEPPDGLTSDARDSFLFPTPAPLVDWLSGDVVEVQVPFCLFGESMTIINTGLLGADPTPR